ncbi:hypothetical protein N9955_00705 [bacterium]|nr:hypothetical protein [bacterium]
MKITTDNPTFTSSGYAEELFEQILDRKPDKIEITYYKYGKLCTETHELTKHISFVPNAGVVIMEIRKV